MTGAAAKPGSVYVLTHPAWRWKSGEVVKIGHTARRPGTRGLQITAASGLIRPPTVFFCLTVPDCAAVEREAHRMLAGCRISRRRELFRVTPEAAADAVRRAAATVGVAGAVWRPAPRRPAHRPPVRLFHVKRRRPVWRRYWRADTVRAALAVVLGIAALLAAGGGR